MYGAIAHCAVVNEMTLILCYAALLEKLRVEEERTKRGSRWAIRAREFMKYCDEHDGGCNIRQNNPSLGMWMSTQRKQYKYWTDGKYSNMTVNRVAILDLIGIVWDAPHAKWYGRLEELKEYRKKEGHCIVPKQYNGNSQLGTWVNDQRKQYRLMKKGYQSPMTEERVRKLEELGFEWKPKRGRICFEMLIQSPSLVL